MQDVPADRETLRQLHQTIQRVTEDLEGMRFNTAIAAMMEFTNHLTPLTVRPRARAGTVRAAAGPVRAAPGRGAVAGPGPSETLAYEPWPSYDPALLEVDEIEVPVQINGKVKVVLTLPSGLDAAGLEKAVLAREEVKTLLVGKTVRRVVVPARGGLVNIVVG